MHYIPATVSCCWTDGTPLLSKLFSVRRRYIAIGDGFIPLNGTL